MVSFKKNRKDVITFVKIFFMKKVIFFFFIFLTINTTLVAQNKTHSSEEVIKLIAKKRAFNKEYGFGYCIQLYYGDETKARELKDKFALLFPKILIKLDYEQPYWKVLIGKYKTKLEADRAMLIYSKEFSGLIVIPLGK